jgi:membrane fusion protein (multidrug efflux system)
VEASSYSIIAPLGGKVAICNLAIGREVNEGDVLVEFVSEAERLQLEAEKTAVASLKPQIDALRDEISAELTARSQQLESGRIAIDQARKQLEEAEASTQLALDEAQRIARLHANGVLSEVDLARAQTEVRKQEAATGALRLQIDRLQADLRNRDSDSQVRIERLKRQIASIEGEIAAGTATGNRLAYDIERRVLRAPLTGRIGEAVDLRVGTMVNASEKLGSIIPPGGLKAIAYFRPSSAVGRVRAGQPARVRLDGFPSTLQRGIEAVVTSVANEPRDELIRVTLDLHLDVASDIPFQHGLPATVEVEIDRVSPLTLLLGAGGKGPAGHVNP